MHQLEVHLHQRSFIKISFTFDLNLSIRDFDLLYQRLIELNGLVLKVISKIILTFLSFLQLTNNRIDPMIEIPLIFSNQGQSSDDLHVMLVQFFNLHMDSVHFIDS